MSADRFPPPRFPSGVGVGPACVVVAVLAGGAALVATGWTVLGGLALLVGALAHLTLRAMLVAPVRTLRDEVALGRPERLTRSAVAETNRVTAALRGRRVGSRRAPVGVALALVASMLVAWVGTAVVSVLGPPAAHPAAAAGAQASLTASTDALRDALRDGLARVESVARPATGAVLAGPADTAAGLLGGPFRAVSVVDAAGRPVAVAGAPPGGAAGSPAAQPGVAQRNTAGAEPLVVASVPMWDGVHTVVAEFDPRWLNDVIAIPDAHTRVVDGDLRTVLDSSGYIAFTALADPVVAPVARSAQGGVPVATGPDTGDGRTVVAGRLAEPGSPLDPGWVVVADRSIGGAAFAGDLGRRVATVVVAGTAAVALAGLAWTAVTAVLPLRRLAAHVESGSGAPLAPQRLDEIGAVTAAVNRWVGR